MDDTLKWMIIVIVTTHNVYKLIAIVKPYTFSEQVLAADLE